MKAYGLSDEAYTFMSSYICDRNKRVKASNIKSSWTKITKGIPQRSGLGPFLLNVFMNDIFYLCKFVIYSIMQMTIL